MPAGALNINDQHGDAQNHALMGMAGIVALLLAGVVALAASTTMRHTARGVVAATLPALATATTAAPVAAETEGSIYFEPGSYALPAEASEVLAKVADAARTQTGKVVLIPGFLDASGDADRNAKLTKSRALAVRHALEANGVAPDHPVMDKPIAMTAGADAREARRVELRLR